MNERELLAHFGVKYIPCQPSVPTEDLWCPPRVDSWLFRIESLVLDGGFGLLSGAAGLGKSAFLRLLHHRLCSIDSVVVGVMERPQSSVGDFYRELGELFHVDLSPANRYGGFKALRARWQTHIKTTLFRPVLLIDEAQEMAAACLNEVRLLGSVCFDSECILTTVLCGDDRLPERFRHRDLIPLGSRIRTRLLLEPYSRDELLDFLDHVLSRAGGTHLLTPGLRDTLVDHALGNLRVLTQTAVELLLAAASRELTILDEKLYFNLYSRQLPAKARARRAS